MAKVKKYIVSSCLLGVRCRYNGTDSLDADILKLFKNGQAIPVCPELLGGLETPREPVEIETLEDGRWRAVDKEKKDYTESFSIGAKSALIIANLCGADTAILKSLSPSCGPEERYDGTFSGTIIKGEGVTAKYLKSKGITVLNENNWNK